jgi:ubiquinone/menaquinone biosynthesis C-methylase UbiE
MCAALVGAVKQDVIATIGGGPFMNIANTPRTYLPAAGRDCALPFYDPLLKLLGADKARRPLLDQAELRPNQRVLDIGCGTGTLVVLTKRLYPEVEIVGLDPDPKALTRAKNKAQRAGTAARFDQGFSDELPYSDGSFDRVFSSLMFHHLKGEEKGKTLKEIRRVLAPRGSLHLMDFVQPEANATGLRAHLHHASAHLKENENSRIITLIAESGLSNAQKIADATIFFGFLQVGYYRAFAA